MSGTGEGPVTAEEIEAVRESRLKLEKAAAIEKAGLESVRIAADLAAHKPGAVQESIRDKIR